MPAASTYAGTVRRGRSVASGGSAEGYLGVLRAGDIGPTNALLVELLGDQSEWRELPAGPPRIKVDRSIVAAMGGSRFGVKE
jgi:hypothetical protein